jgi:hydroxymethylbilane synthase
MANSTTTLRLGTRGSLLARAQSRQVADELEQLHPGLKVELVLIKTTGDQIVDRPLHEAGGKGLFTRELELALLAGQIDLAVHSFKDVPVTMPLVAQEDLTIAATPIREDARDVLVCATATSIKELPKGARIGTGSLRRGAQLLALRLDLMIDPIRGNIDTRLRKQREGEYDAIILAMAGLKRAALFEPMTMHALEVEEFLPAAGQGALAIQCRRDDPRTASFIQQMNHEPTRLCVEMEREVVRRLGGDCHSPIAALATIHGSEVDLKAAVGRRGGAPPLLRAVGSGSLAQSSDVVDHVIHNLMKQGVEAHLHQ